jgi:tetratricopeptide (TPR) repeat protein
VLAGCATGGLHRLKPGDRRAQAFREAIALGDAARYQEARQRWLELLASGEPALEVVAAEKLLAADAELDTEPALIPRLEQLLPQLGFEARDSVMDLLIRRARRGGDGARARALEARRGCLPSLSVGPRLSPLAHLDLEAPRPAGPGRTFLTRACRAQLSAPDGQPGAIATVLPALSGSSLVMIETQADWILMRGGRVLHRHGDRQRYPARLTWLRVRGGSEPVELRLAAVPARVELALAVVPADRAPRGEVELALAPEVPLAGEDGQLLGAYLALHRSDGDQVERLLGGRHDAAALLCRARAAAIDTTRTHASVRTRVRTLLEQALAADPAALRAAYNLALLDIEDDRSREAIERLEGAADRVRFWGWHALWAQALRARGLSAAADDALERARKLAPGACGLLPQLAGAARERHDFAAERRLTEAQRACDAESQALADLCQSRGELDCTISEYRRLLADDPERDSLRLPLAEALSARGQPAEAARVLGELVRREPRQAQYRQKLADALWEAGDTATARRVLREGAAAMPEATELWKALEIVGEPAPLEPFRVDGRKVIAEFEARRVHPQSDASPAVVLLDRTVTRVFATGARLTLTHNIVRVQAKAGIARWGEVQVPPGADVVILRTVKADGTTREPEEIVEKESVSVPDLLPGDYVEFEYIVATPPPAAFEGGFLAERFFFASFDDPLDRTEYVLVTPARMPVDVDARGGMRSEERRASQGELSVRTWARREVGRRIAEPGATPYIESMPSVRASSGVTFERWRAFLRESTFTAARANAELVELARSRCADRTERACVASLTAWVQDNVEHGGTITDAATVTLGRRQGHRVTLLLALLEAAGRKAEIWLVRPVTGDATLPVPQELDDFDQPILHTETGLCDPRARRLSALELPPALAGGRALRIPPAGEGPVLTSVPMGDLVGGSRRISLRARVDPDDGARVEVQEKTSGWVSVEWRELAERNDRVRLAQEFEQRSLGYDFPGAQLGGLELLGLDAGRGPLGVDYRFTAPRLLRRLGGGRRALAPILPAQLERRYVALPERQTPLQIGLIPRTDLAVELALPEAARVQPPPPVVLDTPFGHFSQRVRATPGHLVLERHLEVPLRRVLPGEYARFVAFARAVDEAEQTAIVIELSAEGTRGR